MLTIRENVIETMKKDGHPDRFVKQYEFIDLIFEDLYYMGDYPLQPGKEGYDQYGVFWSFPEGQMGAFPVHDDAHRLLKDITEWKEVVRRPVAPPVPGYWEMLKHHADSVDRTQKYACALQTQGVFERLHALMGMEDAMMSFYEEPEVLKELIDFIVDIELEFARNMVEKVGVDAVLHHDDWGSASSTFMSPAMFEEFILPAYKKIYGYYKEHNVLIIHHNDAFSATLVPYMIEMGMDIWQGPIPCNNIPELIEKYGGQITFMGEIETRVCDIPEWKEDVINKEVERACQKCGIHSFIPCQTSGVPGSAFPGVYEAIDKAIDEQSKKMFV